LKDFFEIFAGGHSVNGFKTFVYDGAMCCILPVCCVSKPDLCAGALRRGGADLPLSWARPAKEHVNESVPN
jgi:hypothetical protein